uniref:UL6 like n=1 Tax=Anatid alphaherpesvirus 2 TaxID=3080522 RepID=A0AAU0K8F6_9ALPH
MALVCGSKRRGGGDCIFSAAMPPPENKRARRVSRLVGTRLATEGGQTDCPLWCRGYERSAADDWVMIHPTPKTRLFKEILMGEYGYTEGQGVYNSVRSTETAIRQVQVTILTNTLGSTRYEDLRRDWDRHVTARGMDARTLASRYGIHSEGEAVRVAERVFDTWRRTLQVALLDLIRSVAACFSAVEPDSAASFSKYIDWICCLGLVPLIRRTPKKRLARTAQTDKCVESLRSSRLADANGAGDSDSSDGSAARAGSAASDNLAVAGTVLEHGKAVAAELAECVESVTIMDYDRACIEYNFTKREVRVKDAVTGETGECMVLWRPVLRDGGVIFDSPLQRLYREVMACHELRHHVNVCRLLNTAPVKVLLARKAEDDRGLAGAQRAVDRALGGDGQAESAAGSAAARLVKLIINMKGMKHVGDITETVREYLEETGGHLLDTATIDTSQAGFGRAVGRSGAAAAAAAAGLGDGGTRVRDAFNASVVGSINGMLEGYVNKLFGTVEGLKAANEDLVVRLRAKESELERSRRAEIGARQEAADVKAGLGGGRADTKPSVDDPISMAAAVGEMGHDVIDVGPVMGDETYVANSFQSRYVPSYEGDVSRLSSLWEQELVRCFKMTRVTNNQGQEMSLSYSNSAITLLVAPYFFSILRVRRLGFMVTTQEAYRSEEELCDAIFKKTRLEVYLDDLSSVFVADVRRAVTRLNADEASNVTVPEGRIDGRSSSREDVDGPSYGESNYYYDSSSSDVEEEDGDDGRRGYGRRLRLRYDGPTPARHERHPRRPRVERRHGRRGRGDGQDNGRAELAGHGAHDVRGSRGVGSSDPVHGRVRVQLSRR